MNKKVRSNQSEKWRHTRTSVEIAWTNEHKADLKWLWRHMVVKKSRRRNKKEPREGYLCAAINKNIAGRLAENSFVDLQSQKDFKREIKRSFFLLIA